MTEAVSQPPLVRSPASSLGPEPFRFVPSTGTAVHGPAFTVSFKAVATAIVVGCTFAVGRLWFGAGVSHNSSVSLWFVAALAMLAMTWWSILRSTTRIKDNALFQRWMWDKHMDLSELAYARLIRIRGFDMIIAPRLYARTLAGRFAVFYGATPELLAEFERIAAEVRAFRAM